VWAGRLGSVCCIDSLSASIDSIIGIGPAG